MFNYLEVKIKDFSGGMTDRFIDGPHNTSKKIANLNITKFNTLEIRDGYRWYLEPRLFESTYASATNTGYLGVVNLAEESHLIISQGPNFHVLNKEVQLEANTTSNTASSDGYIDSNKIHFNLNHGFSNGDEIYFEGMETLATGVEDRVAYYANVQSASGSSIKVHLSYANAVAGGGAGTGAITLTGTTFFRTIKVTKKATATEIQPPTSGNTLLKLATLGDYQAVCFSEWQDQLLTTSDSSSQTELSRPGMVYYGTVPIIVDNSASGINGHKFKAVGHGLTVGDTLAYESLSGSDDSSLTDYVTYYISDETDPVGADEFRVSSAAASGDIGLTAAIGVSEFNPTTLGWKSHTLGLPIPCVDTNGNINYTSFTQVQHASALNSTSAKTFLYACVYKYIYYANGIKKVIYGPPRKLNASMADYSIEQDYDPGFSVDEITTADGSGTLDGVIPVAATTGLKIGDIINVTNSDNDTVRETSGNVKDFHITEIADGVSITVAEGAGGEPLNTISPDVTTADGSGTSGGVIPVAATTGLEIDDIINVTNAAGDTIKATTGTVVKDFHIIAISAGVSITVSAESGGGALDITTASIISTDKIYLPNIVSTDKIYLPGQINKATGAERGYTVTVTAPCLQTATEGIYKDAQWDLNRVMIEIYRTKANGTVYYHIGGMRNKAGSATADAITDNLTDDAIGLKRALYTTGGILERHPAPPCKYILTSKNVSYFANVIEEVESITEGKFFKESKPTRVYQSIPGQTSSIGSSSYVDLDDDIVGIGEVNGLPLVFTETYIYRIEGVISAIGSGTMRARIVDENIGCCSHASIVKTPRGLFFAGLNGFYQTDGYKVVSITEHLDDSFRDITKNATARKLINGTYDEKTLRIIWGVCEENNTEANLAWVLNLRTGGFTTIEGTSFAANSLAMLNDEMYRSDQYGTIYRHSEEYLHDSVLTYGADSLPDPVHEWLRTPILFDYLSNAMHFGFPAKRKWVNEATFSIQSNSNLGLQPTSTNDGSSLVDKLKPITRGSTWTWEDPDFVWGDSRFKWGTPDVVTGVRRFPRSSMRCRRKQVGLKPAEYTRYLSDDWYKAFLSYDDETGLLSAIVYQWPQELEASSICFPTTLDASTGRYIYDAEGTTTSCYAIEERTSNTEIKFYAGSLDGWLTYTSGNYLTFKDDNTKDQVIKLSSNLYTYDATQPAGSKETGTFGVTKDWTIEFWMQCDANSTGHIFALDNHTIAHDNPGTTIFFEYGYLSVKLYSDTGSQILWRTTHSTYEDSNIVWNGSTWNHIVLTSRGTALETDTFKTNAATDGDSTPGLTVYYNGVRSNANDDDSTVRSALITAGDAGAALTTPNIFLGDSDLEGASINMFKIWDAYKTEAQVQVDYNEGSPLDTTEAANCAMQLKFDELALGTLTNGITLLNTGYTGTTATATVNTATDTDELEVVTKNVEWTIKKKELEQTIEIKEIDIKYSVMDNVEGRFQKEDEASNE